MATISRLPSGRYQCKIRRKGVNVSSTFRTQQLAKEWAKHTEDQIDLGRYNVKVAPMTVPELLEKYRREMTHRNKSWKVETYILRRLMVEFDGLTLDTFGADDVVAYVDRRQRAGIGPDTIRKDLAKLSRALETGKALWGCEFAENPVTVAKGVLKAKKTLGKGRERDRRISADEEAALLDSPIGHIVEFALETAMRRGEIANATAAHLSGDTLYIPETKTDKPRTIPLTRRAKEILEANPTGFGYAARSLSKMFLEACRANGIEDLRLHDLRHESTSRFFERHGLTIEEVAIITGHSDWRMLKRYTHLKAADIAKKL